MLITETPMPPYPWQNEIWHSFCESVVHNRVAHAMLVSGVVGVGLETLAFAMARYLLCVSPLEDVACGRCRGCQLTSSGTHPDLYLLKREEDASQIKVDQVRACVEFVAKTSHAQGPKVVLVLSAEAMNINAANALLKSLEEPQGRTIFVLTSNRLSSILPTIRSRCRAVNVSVPDTDLAIEWLTAQGLDVGRDVLAQAGGAPVLAKRWVEGDYIELQVKVSAALERLLLFQVGAIQVASEWVSAGPEPIIHIQIQILEAAIKNNHVTVASGTFKSQLIHMLDEIDALYLFRLRDKLLEKLSQLQGSANLNVPMLCEELAMDWVAFAQLLKRSRN